MKRPSCIEGLRKLDKASCPAPWFHDLGNWNIETHDKAHYRWEVCDLAIGDSDKNFGGLTKQYKWAPNTGDFIVELRNNITELLSYIEYLEEKVDV